MFTVGVDRAVTMEKPNLHRYESLDENHRCVERRIRGTGIGHVGMRS